MCPNHSPPLYPSAYCYINIKESGMMTSRTRVNGVEHTDSVTIYCSSAEPLLNYDAIRQKMMSVLDSSGYPAAVSVERVDARILDRTRYGYAGVNALRLH